MARSTAALVAGGDVAVAHHEHLPVANALQREDTLELIARETLEQAAAAAAVEPGERCAGVAYAGRYGLSSKDTTPAQLKAVTSNWCARP